MDSFCDPKNVGFSYVRFCLCNLKPTNMRSENLTIFQRCRHVVEYVDNILEEHVQDYRLCLLIGAVCYCEMLVAIYPAIWYYAGKGNVLSTP